MTLSLMMDIVVLLALGVTIFYAVRLSNSLNAFKKYRSEFETLIKTLSDNIDQAYGAIEALKGASEQAGRDLQDTLSDSQYMIDELRLINEASDNLAHRLEQAALKGRKPDEAVQAHQGGGAGTKADRDEDDPSWQSTLSVKMRDDKKGEASKAPAKKAADKDGASIFSIRDPDYERDAGSNDAFASQAEQDLYEALQGKKRM